jgi:nitrogen fixation NifU-like protein
MDLGELYQELILDHSRRPHHYGRPEGADRVALGHNPLCGDRYSVFLAMDGDRIAAIGFEGEGCAISKSSASLMTDAVAGKTRAEAEALAQRFQDLVTGKGRDESLGKLLALAGVAAYPIRVKCASLAWHTLRAALASKKDTVSLE